MGRSIVQDMIDNRTGDAMILRVLMAQARNRGVLLAAKKVETEEQCLMLSRNLIEEMQGSVFSKALVAEDITVLLRDNTCLSDRLSRAQKVDRTLLLVDDEVNILSALKRTLRRNNYRILTAESGSAALALLDEHKVDVIVSDQRMPEMTGVQFFTQAKQKFPDTVRIILSGYTELQSVTDAINEGAVYRFVTKPWDDTKLREHIAEAFQRKEMADENQHLNQELRRANLDLAEANRQLAILLEKQKEQIIHNEMSLHIVREALQQVPLPVIGLDEDDTIVFINVAATAMLEGMDIGLGHDICQIIPGFICTDADYGVARRLDVHGRQFVAWAHKMGQGSQSRGTLLVIAEHEESYHETHH